MIEAILPWVLSAITLWMTFLAGNRDPKAWSIGLGGQALWLWWIVSASAWGFLPLTVSLTALYARNLIKWRREC